MTFAVTSGDATLDGAAADTNAEGIATMSLTLGAGTGDVTVAATVAGSAANHLHDQGDE